VRERGRERERVGGREGRRACDIQGTMRGVYTRQNVYMCHIHIRHTHKVYGRSHGNATINYTLIIL